MISLRKSVIICISILLVFLVGFVALYDISIDKCILEVEGVKYQEDDFAKYYKLVELENAMSQSGEPLDVYDVYEQYVNIKIYLRQANQHGITLTEEEKKSIEENYDSENLDKNVLEEFGITKEEYIRYYIEVMLASKFIRDAGTYYQMPESDYPEYRDAYSDGFKMYNYRILQVSAVPTFGEDEEKTVSDEDRQLAKSKAEEALDKIKSGEDFEEIAGEYGSYRIVATIDGYTISNGQLETMPLLYLNEAVENLDLYTELVSLSAGEYTSIIEEGDSYLFAKLESVEEGLDEASEARLRSDINTLYAQQFISSNTKVIKNLTKVKRVINDNVDQPIKSNNDSQLNEVENLVTEQEN